MEKRKSIFYASAAATAIGTLGAIAGIGLFIKDTSEPIERQFCIEPVVAEQDLRCASTDGVIAVMNEVANERKHDNTRDQLLIIGGGLTAIGGMIVMNQSTISNQIDPSVPSTKR